MFKKYIGDLFVTLRFYIVAGVCIIIFILSFFLPLFFPLAKIIFVAFLLLVAADYFFLFIAGKKPVAERLVSDRLSNGDSNTIVLSVTNNSSYFAAMKIIDELPFQFQERNFSIQKHFLPRQQLKVSYIVKPAERGSYFFGNILLYVQSRQGLVVRRHVISAQETVKEKFLQRFDNQVIDGKPDGTAPV